MLCTEVGGMQSVKIRVRAVQRGLSDALRCDRQAYFRKFTAAVPLIQNDR